MAEPNDAQRRIIESTEGVYCVDAGPGTGKTFALTRRYATIVDQPGVEPDDVLLATFTRNAATEMKERVVERSSYGLQTLHDAPIQTFHSLCHDLLLEHGFASPQRLGIDDHVTSATRLLEDELVEAQRFRTFIDVFADDHPEYADVFRVVPSPGELLGLIKQLAAKGVFPTADGWYQDGEAVLDGDAEAFRACFDAANQPRNDGRKQSVLRADLGSYGRDKCYRTDAPPRGEIRGHGTKAVPAAVADQAFEEDREALKAFVHDVYHGYLSFALARNYLNFGFLQGLAYVLLCEDDRLRRTLAFDYVMVDEFQDTSEIQFKLALLLLGTANFCVVGDWKQSIYAFQYAAVENIQAFEDRLARFVGELNADRERVPLSGAGVEIIELVENYRSTQTLIDFAERGLLVPATSRESVDVEGIREEIVSLTSNADHDESRIEAVRHNEEAMTVLTLLQRIVGNDDYRVTLDGERRTPGYGDIAVLTRTRDFGRELRRRAEEYGIPMAYEGGIELYRTDQAKLLLAWLRVLESDADRGWAVVLERAGYTLDEIRHLLDEGPYPAAMRRFRAELEQIERVGAVAERVFGQYGFDGPEADVVLDAVQSVHDQTSMTRGDLVRLIERGIEQGSTRELAASAGSDAVTVQTIHAAKGLEYPIVVLANMNRHAFPRTGGGSNGVIQYADPVGLRQRKRYASDHGQPHVYDNWRWDVLRASLPGGYDEERRLLYVAMTRAQDHLVFTAGETPNAFLEALPVEVTELAPDVASAGRTSTVQTAFTPTVQPAAGPVRLSAHDLMDDAVFAETPEGRGTAFGTRVHAFAEAYALGRDVEPDDDGEPDWAHVTAFIDDLAGQPEVEEEVTLPLAIDGQSVVLVGVVDLVHVRPDTVEVFDFKTDRDRAAHDEYRTQVSVYHHVLDACYPDRDVTTSLFYTTDDEVVPVEPKSFEALAAIAREHPRVARRLGD